MLRRVSFSLLVLLTAALAAQAADFSVGGIYYNVKGAAGKQKVEVTYSDLQNGSYAGDVVIPAQVTWRMVTYPVTGIGDHAFFNCPDLTSVSIPEGVTYIDQQAFSHCYSLPSVKLPSTLQRIEDFAFEFCPGITKVEIPAAVTRIGTCAFQVCDNLASFTVDPANPRFASVDGILYSADGSSLIGYPEALEGEEFAFPETVKRVTEYAFSTNQYLRKVHLNAALEAVTSLTFCDCRALEHISVSSENAAMTAVDGVLYSKDMTSLLQYPPRCPEDVFEVPQGVTDIEDLSMAGAVHLVYLTLPASLQRIGYLAFATTSNLAEITSLNPTPPEGAYGSDIFEPQVYSGAMLYVPEASVAAYRANAQWGRFAWIEPIVDSGIDEISADTVEETGKAVYFDLLGRCVDASAPSARFRLQGRTVRRL